MADTLAGILQELVPGWSLNPHSWLLGFSIVAQVLFFYVHQPVVRILMGDEGFDSLTLDMLTDHITRYSLAAIGQGPPVTAGLQASAPSSEEALP